MIHKKQRLLADNNFSDFPENIIPTSDRIVTIKVNGNGLIKGLSGKRWWDSNVLTDDGEINSTQGSVIRLPFTKDFLSNKIIDLIARVTINGNNFLYAASNSADNLVTTTAPSNALLYYLDLVCMGLQNTIGDSNTDNNFMQGGLGIQSQGANLIKIYLSDPAPSNGAFNIVATYIAYDGTVPNTPAFTKSVPYVAGVNFVPAIATAELFLHYYYADYYATYAHAGYYKISVTNPDSGYRSLLNFYHWGQAS